MGGRSHRDRRGAAVAAICDDDENIGIQAVGGAIRALPALLLLPLCAWALSSLIEFQAWKLDVTMLEVDLQEAIGE